MPNPSELQRQSEEITPWEELPYTKHTTLIRVADSRIGIATYEFGYIVGTIASKPCQSGKYRLRSVTYPSHLAGVARVLGSKGMLWNTKWPANFWEALEATVKIEQAIKELQDRLEAARCTQ